LELKEEGVPILRSFDKEQRVDMRKNRLLSTKKELRMDTLRIKMTKLVVSFLLLVAMIIAALTGIANVGGSSQGITGVQVVHASGCDGGSPPPDLDCPVIPTPTPTALRG
jgi:hypothetical protein